MIHRIRELAASLHEGLADDLRALNVQQQDEEDEDPEPDHDLELLLKHAARSSSWEHDPRSVWKQLSARVMGPFGSMAVEEPALMGQMMPMSSETAEVTGQSPEALRHSFFRLSEGAFPAR